MMTDLVEGAFRSAGALRGTFGQFYLPAAEDLTSGQYLLVTINSDMQIATIGTTEGAYEVGVLQNAPFIGEPALVRSDGLTLAIADGAINKGDRLRASSGKAGRVTVDDRFTYEVGYALSDAADGDPVSIWFRPQRRAP